MMTDAEVYEFDLHGMIVYRNVLSREFVDKANAQLDKKLAGDKSWSFDFIADDPMYMELLAHPKTMGVLRTMIGDWFRLDHAYGIQMTQEIQTNDNLHGGPRTDQWEHCYQWSQGRMHNGLVVVAYALEDVNPGDGGFIGVPGSHKANLPFIPPVTSHLVVNPTLEAGEMLIFTEALVHGTRRWKSLNRRRSLLYKYSPGYSSWAGVHANDRLIPLATTPMQKDLLRLPYVGGRGALPFEQ